MHQLGVGLAAVDIAGDAFLLLCRDQRAHGGGRIHLVAELDLLGVLDDLLQHLVVHLLMQEQARAGGADLAHVAEDRHRGDLRRLIDRARPRTR